MARYTPKSPRTQATICGAPKEIAMPKIAATHQPQEMRFAMAMAPSTMMRMIAMGVSQARMFVCSAVAPVRKGDACASARFGAKTTSDKRNAGVNLPDPIDRRDIALPSPRYGLASRAPCHHDG